MSLEELQKIISSKFTREVLLEIVSKAGNLKDVDVEKIQTEDSSVKKGDSYLSDIFRFTIDAEGTNKTGERERISVPVLVKYLPKNLARRKTYRSMEFFENEGAFFEKVWPAFQKFQTENNFQEKFDNIPTVLATWIDGTNDYIALLDLSYQGFQNVDRVTGLDYDHTVAILKTIAKFHSLSLAFKTQNLKLFEEAANSLQETYFDEKYRSWYERFHQRLFIIARDAVEKELPPLYLKKLNQLLSLDLYGELCKKVKVRGPLGVVAHGDLWIPNFLIKYNNQKVDQVALIDLQLTRYTSLVNDLTVFLYICVEIDLIEKHWDEFIIIYHEALSDSLEKFGYSGLVSLESLQEEIKTMSVFGVGVPIEGLIMSLLDEADVADLDAIQGVNAVPIETVWKVHPFNEQEKRRRFARMIKHAVDRNFI